MMKPNEALDILDSKRLSGEMSENDYAVKRAWWLAEAAKSDHDKRMAFLSYVTVIVLPLAIIGLLLSILGS